MVKKYYKKALLLLFVVCCLSFVALPAVAAGLVPCTGSDCTICHFLKMIHDVLFFVVYKIVAPLAGLLFLIGGIMMMLSGASEDWLKKGKELCKNTLIGILIILSSWVIVNTLITTFGVRVGGFIPSSWNEVNCASEEETNNTPVNPNGPQMTQ